MAQPKALNQKSKYKALNARLSKYVLLVQNLYDTYNLEASKIAVSTGFDGIKPFSFSDYPLTKQRVQSLLTGWQRDLTAIITAGTAKEWANGNYVQDLLADKVLSYYYGKEHGQRKRKYYQTNSDALQAFQKRVENGMNLSQKIWDQSENYKTELEAALSSGIQKGMSAVTLSKRVSKYLNDFDSLKHDYKQKYGKEVDCLNCEYRSIRLARSEINMAYRTAEQERWLQFDFVLGYEIKLSKSHHERMPHGDICDDLKGKYPKDFRWTGWHPNDMCYVVPILKTEEQFFEDKPSEDEIIEMPQNYKEWCAKNASRINQADRNGTLPYFLEQNPDFRKYIGVKSIAEYRHRTRDEQSIRIAAKNRHDMAEVSDNLLLASIRREAHYIGYDISELEQLIRTKDLKYDKYGESKIFDDAKDKVIKELRQTRSEINASYSKLVKLRNDIKNCIGAYKTQSALDEIEKAISGYNSFSSTNGISFNKIDFDRAHRIASKKHKENIKRLNSSNTIELEEALGIKKGHPMSFMQADEGRGNIRYKKGVVNPYSINCQVCVVADELRRRGFNVTALGRLVGNGEADAIAYHTEKPWIEASTGKSVHKKRILLTGKDEKTIFGDLDSMTKTKGRYHIDWAWEGGDTGHIVCLERRANGTLRCYDPQNGKMISSIYDIMKLISRMDKNYSLNVLKVDELLINPRAIRKIVKPL